MSIVILLICFFSIFFNIGILTGPKFNIKEILLKSVLVFSAILVFITELASIFHLLNFQFILMSWIGISILSVSYLIFKKEILIIFSATVKRYIKNSFKEFNKFERFLSFSVFIILVLVFIQGIVYPPNYWDSMNYHMARIPSWISHQSVAHYPSHIFRQIYQPPFSEFAIMHINILNYGDYFSNLVQFFFLVFSLFAIVSIVELFGLSRQYKLIAIILTVTIPEVILQASSTQNDIVVSFFILTSIYFAVNAVKEVNIKTYFFLGLSIGLAALTKGTAYIYLAPVLLIFAIVVLLNLYKSKNYAYLVCSVFAVFIFISINSGHYYRNYNNLNHSILGLDKNESELYSNQNLTPILLLSNIIKNAGLHSGPYPINEISNRLIYKLHSVAGVDINNSGTTFLNMSYNGSPRVPNGEDNASNPLHFFLMLLSFILIGLNILKNKKESNKIALYAGMIIVQFILFCALIKWQPWNTRLHIPLFMLSIPLICYAISLNDKHFKILIKLTPIIIFYAFLIILFNNIRPYITLNKITSAITITDDRYKKYYASRLDVYEEYKDIMENVNEMHYKDIGLILGWDDWEYPLFSKAYTREINPIHINVTNITRDIPLSLNIRLNNIDCIISTTINNAVIDFNGKNFYNQNCKNKNIWLYK